jgi:hypothetical protein
MQWASSIQTKLIFGSSLAFGNLVYCKHSGVMNNIYQNHHYCKFLTSTLFFLISYQIFFFFRIPIRPFIQAALKHLDILEIWSIISESKGVITIVKPSFIIRLANWYIKDFPAPVVFMTNVDFLLKIFWIASNWKDQNYSILNFLKRIFSKDFFDQLVKSNFYCSFKSCSFCFITWFKLISFDC